MKITNLNFLAAKRDGNLNALLVIQRTEKDNAGNSQLRKYIRLCIRQYEKYTNSEQTVFVETDTEICIENYSNHEHAGKRAINEICFHMSIYYKDSYIRTFLNAIKREADIKFRVVAFNSCEVHKRKQLVAHQLYGIIDDKTYLLASYVGEDNLASPVK